MYEQQDLKLVAHASKLFESAEAWAKRIWQSKLLFHCRWLATSNEENGDATWDFVKVAEALQVSADYLLRPDVPEVKAIYQGEFAELLEDCSASEDGTILKIVREVKASMQ